MTAAAPVVLIAHGTRDEAGRDELRALTRSVAAGVASPVRCGVIEYPAAGLEPVFATLAAAAEDARRLGRDEVRLVPLLLFPAGHAGDDLAVVIRGARLLHPGVRWRCAPLLRPSPALLAALGERVRAADAALGERAAAIVVAGRGTTSVHANRRLERLVAVPLHALDGRPVEHAFASLAAPAVGEALERLRDAGHESAVVAPYLLNEGLIARRVRRETEHAAARLGMRVAVAGHLGLHPAVLAYLRARARGDRSGGAASALTATPLRPARMRHPRPIVVAGCASGTGKSTLALGLIAALRARGLRVQPFKVGPDYIDPLHHNAVAGRVSRNLDSVLCEPRSLPALAARAVAGADVAVVEGVLGLFDGRLGGGDAGSTAEVARLVDGVVVLVVDAARAARSVAAVALGFARFDPTVRIEAVVLNRVGSERHARTAAEAVEAATGIPVVGCIPRDDDLTLPERYLGLVPPQERPHPPRWAERLGATVERSLDLDALLRLAARGRGPVADPDHDPFAIPAAPARVRIGVARDGAFSFHYADALDLLASRGAELVPVSPLGDTALPDCDALWLPGGFPERFAATLAANAPMRASVAAALRGGMPAVAECGGAMYLGTAITTEDGERHPMCGVLPYGTRMGARRSLGYRDVTALRGSPLLDRGARAAGHEFHWSEADPAIDAGSAAWSTGPGGAPEGHATPALLASYIHLHLCGVPGAAARLVAAAERHRHSREPAGARGR
ncbi:MAG TPA: cobyrinate a,c-diamide synthase [Candidatus Dormibacteraeota bacterium]|nr:cobyrinate a,c-diamide synthase [Candidatus Dormibacteraeota bacterium]